MLIETLILMVEQKHEFDSKDLAYLNSFILFTEKKLKREMEIDVILALKLVDFILEGMFYSSHHKKRAPERHVHIYCSYPLHHPVPPWTKMFSDES